MIDINVIRENPQRVKEALAKKLWDVDFTELLQWDKQKKELIQIVEGNKAKMNELSASVPASKKAGEDVNLIFAKVREIAANNKEYKANTELFKGNIGDLAEILRITLTGRRNAPSLYAVMALLGLEESHRRMERVISLIK
jgi:seryl-tRNA synthetase